MFIRFINACSACNVLTCLCGVAVAHLPSYYLLITHITHITLHQSHHHAVYLP